ncbi:MAG: hypothetical protein ACLR8Y_08825 [Alistipes indistinctus]
MLLSLAGLFAAAATPGGSAAAKSDAGGANGNAYYQQFRNPDPKYRPFVRWWWNSDKVNADELRRELYLLKDAGIGGVRSTPSSSRAEPRRPRASRCRG